MYRGSQGFSLNLVWTLIVINVIIFIAVQVRPDLVPLLGIRPLTFESRPWTLLTSIFVHQQFFHLLFNMLALYFLGSFLLGLLGEGKFAIVYFGGGLLGSLLYVLLAPSFQLAIGASGAIYSIGGALVVLRPKLPVILFPIPAPIPLWVAIIGGFLLVFAFSAWQAHLGGLIFGLAFGYALRRRSYY